MKKLIWKLVWKVICKWEKVAENNGLQEQVDECTDIKVDLIHFKNAMKQNGLW